MGLWMIFGGLIFILFWAAVIALIIWLVRRSSHEVGPGVPSARTPLDIAKERYARGEITKEQFEQIKKDLNS